MSYNSKLLQSKTIQEIPLSWNTPYDLNLNKSLSLLYTFSTMKLYVLCFMLFYDLFTHFTIRHFLFFLFYFLLPIWFYVDGVVFSGVASWLLFAVIRSHSRNTMSFNSIPCQLPHHNNSIQMYSSSRNHLKGWHWSGVEWTAGEKWLPFALWMNRNVNT